MHGGWKRGDCVLKTVEIAGAHLTFDLNCANSIGIWTEVAQFKNQNMLWPKRQHFGKCICLSLVGLCQLLIISWIFQNWICGWGRFLNGERKGKVVVINIHSSLSAQWCPPQDHLFVWTRVFTVLRAAGPYCALAVGTSHDSLCACGVQLQGDLIQHLCREMCIV